VRSSQEEDSLAFRSNSAWLSLCCNFQEILFRPPSVPPRSMPLLDARLIALESPPAPTMSRFPLSSWRPHSTCPRSDLGPPDLQTPALDRQGLSPFTKKQLLTPLRSSSNDTFQPKNFPPSLNLSYSIRLTLDGPSVPLTFFPGVQLPKVLDQAQYPCPPSFTFHVEFAFMVRRAVRGTLPEEVQRPRPYDIFPPCLRRRVSRPPLLSRPPPSPLG